MTTKGAEEAVKRLLENKTTIRTLERQLQEAKENSQGADTVGEPIVYQNQLQEDLQQTDISEKAKKAKATTETEITRLRDELRQSPDKEASIGANAKNNTTS